MSTTPDTAKGTAAKAVSQPPFTVSVKVLIDAIILPEPAGGFSAVVPALPGCGTCGDTVEEVMAYLVEAAQGWLESQHDIRKDEALKTMTEPLPGESAS